MHRYSPFLIFFILFYFTLPSLPSVLQSTVFFLPFLCVSPLSTTEIIQFLISAPFILCSLPLSPRSTFTFIRPCDNLPSALSPAPGVRSPQVINGSLVQGRLALIWPCIPSGTVHGHYTVYILPPFLSVAISCFLP